MLSPPPLLSSPPAFPLTASVRLEFPPGDIKGDWEEEWGGEGVASKLNSKVQSYRSGDKFTDDNRLVW